MDKNIMLRYLVVFITVILTISDMCGQRRIAVVADSVSHASLPGASVFDCKGRMVGISNTNGRLPFVSADCYPITLRYLGFNEKTVSGTDNDTIFLSETIAELPEVVVESGRHKVMHMLAYVREYSTLTSYTDTVFLFREKMVDYMLVPDRNIRFKGWSSPRILACRSYYRFTNAQGLDSVSDESNYHFSWSDWIGVVPSLAMPTGLRSVEQGTDTLSGKYSPTEIWMKNNDRVTVAINVLADTASRKWVPNLRGFFRDDLDFENFRIRFNYSNIVGESVDPMDITGYSFNIESQGRGHGMFRFNRVNEPFFVSTYAEVYMLDKEYITVKEAKRWESRRFHTGEIEIYEAYEAPALQSSVRALIERVDSIDKADVRLAIPPDRRFAGRKSVKHGPGRRVLQLLKSATGISSYKMNRNNNRQWKEFRIRRMKENNSQNSDSGRSGK